MSKLQRAFTATWAVLICVARASQFDSCGIKGTPARQSRIVNGAPASQCEWPWQAGLITSSGFLRCGGTLISEDWVLTAAHCLIHPSIDDHDIRVILGDLRRSEVEETQEVFGVAAQLVHPSYDGDTLDYDIALLRLDRPATLSGCIRPACLPDPDEEDLPYGEGELCHVTGWGRTAWEGLRPEVLQEAAAVLYEDERCRFIYGLMGIQISQSTMLCVGGDRNGEPISACNGDSGGPVVCADESDVYTVHGVASFTYQCGSVGEPTVYAKVTAGLPWITATQDLSGSCDALHWPNVDGNDAAVCGGCTAELENFGSAYGSCDGYCRSIHRSCVGAWRAGSDWCQAAEVLSCGDITEDYYQICSCSDADPCDTLDWPNVDGNDAAVCGHCTAEVENLGTTYSSCDSHCRHIGRTCIGAWRPDDSYWCQATEGMFCDEITNDTYQICACSGVDPCSTRTWPNVDLNDVAVCGHCRAEVQNFGTAYGTCERYCRHIGTTCLGAWRPDDAYWCRPSAVLSCDEVTEEPYQICACSAEPTFSLTPQLLFRSSGLATSYDNMWPGWYMKGYLGMQTNGKSELSYGKQSAYDELCLYAITFKDATGTYATYQLSEEYRGMTLVEIVGTCTPKGSAGEKLPPDRVKNTGEGPWRHGHCEIGHLEEHHGRSFSAKLRLFVGDDSVHRDDWDDWAIFMPVMGNGDGDFQESNAWAFGSKGETCTGYQNMVSIEGYEAYGCADAGGIDAF